MKNILLGLTISVGYRTNIYMSEVLYKIMHCTGWKRRLYAKSKLNCGTLWSVLYSVHGCLGWIWHTSNLYSTCFGIQPQTYIFALFRLGRLDSRGYWLYIIILVCIIVVVRLFCVMVVVMLKR